MISRNTIAALGVSAAALVGIAVHEGYSDKPYLDSVGVWTSGFGTTSGVKPGQVTDPVGALVRLHADVSAHASGLVDCFGDVRLYQHEWDAFISLAYNVGAPAVCRSSIPGKLRAERYADACRAILSFDKIRDCSKAHVTGKCPLVPLRGLTIRRQAEYKTCLGDDFPAAKQATADKVKPGGEH